MLQDTAVSARPSGETTYGGMFQLDNDKISRISLAERFEAEAVPHFPVLKRLALNLVRNQAQAEDLVQETFAQALKSFDRFEAGTNCRAWLCKIMFYKRSQWIRANRRFCQFDENDTDFPSTAAAVLLPPDFISDKLASALAALPDKFRQIIWLAAVEEFTYREIAARLDIPVGTVMSRLHRGRKMLHANFNHHRHKTCAPNEYN